VDLLQGILVSSRVKGWCIKDASKLRLKMRRHGCNQKNCDRDKKDEHQLCELCAKKSMKIIHTGRFAWYGPF
jgi:hypothetical protein